MSLEETIKYNVSDTNTPVSRIVDMKTGDLITVYKNIDGSVIGWNRKGEKEGEIIL